MNLFRKVLRSSFIRAIMVLSGAQSVSMALPILAAPILGRLYIPADYGVLAQFMAPAAVLAVLATFQFHTAVIIERSAKAAVEMVWICIISSCALGIIVSLGVLVFWKSILINSSPGFWYLVTPIAVFFGGMVASGAALANRQRRYQLLGLIVILQSLTTVCSAVFFGLLSLGANGLVASYVLGQAVLVVFWFVNLPKLLTNGSHRPTLDRVLVLARRHKKFAFFTTPSEFLGQVIMQAPVITLALMGADSVLGAFSRARQLIAMPISLLEVSVTKVFLETAAREIDERGSCTGLMVRTVITLLATTAAPFVILAMFAEDFFTVFLGPNWSEAGIIAQILAPMLWLRLAVKPVTSIFLIVGRQLEDFVLTLFFSLFVVFVLAGTVWFFQDTQLVIIMYSVVFSVIYFAYLFRSFALSKLGGGKKFLP